ncbi:hypothetical protein [Pontibacter mangrovi]|nr:hypothetical protein [Pontibacter mangrovi]
MVRIHTQVLEDGKPGSTTITTYYFFGIPFWRVTETKQGGRYG